jgi:hypothetical protein
MYGKFWIGKIIYKNLIRILLSERGKYVYYINHIVFCNTYTK